MGKGESDRNPYEDQAEFYIPLSEVRRRAASEDSFERVMRDLGIELGPDHAREDRDETMTPKLSEQILYRIAMGQVRSPGAPGNSPLISKKGRLYLQYDSMRFDPPQIFGSGSITYLWGREPVAWVKVSRAHLRGDGVFLTGIRGVIPIEVR